FPQGVLVPTPHASSRRLFRLFDQLDLDHRRPWLLRPNKHRAKPLLPWSILPRLEPPGPLATLILCLSPPLLPGESPGLGPHTAGHFFWATVTGPVEVVHAPCALTLIPSGSCGAAPNILAPPSLDEGLGFLDRFPQGPSNNSTRDWLTSST